MRPGADTVRAVVFDGMGKVAREGLRQAARVALGGGVHSAGLSARPRQPGRRLMLRSFLYSDLLARLGVAENIPQKMPFQCWKVPPESRFAWVSYTPTRAGFVPGGYQGVSFTAAPPDAAQCRRRTRKPA